MNRTEQSEVLALIREALRRYKVENPGGGGGGGLTDGDYGDVTVSGGGTAITVDAGAINTTKMGGDVTTAGKALLDDTDAAAQRTTLGLGSIATAADNAYAKAFYGVEALAISSTVSEVRMFTHCNSGSTAYAADGSAFLTRAANGGSGVLATTANLVSFNQKMLGVISCLWGTTSNNTGYASLGTASVDWIVGLPTPTAAGNVVYVFEMYGRSDAIPTSSSQGSFRIGFLGSLIGLPSNGMYFEFLNNGTTTDTQWHWVWRKDGAQTRNALASTSLAANTYYYFKATITRNTAGDVTLDWVINSASGTITVLNANLGTNNVPVDTNTSTGDSMGAGALYGKTGTAHILNGGMHIDWMGIRVRREYAPDYQPTYLP